MGIEALLSTQIIDTTTVGRAVMTAVDAAEALSAIGAVPTARQLTINGTAYDLSADRSWTVSGGISSLNSLTNATQTFTTGTAGTDFGVVSAAGVHTFNLPSASTTARGVVATGTQTIAGQKTIQAQAATDVPLTVQGAAGQSAAAFRFLNSTGQLVFQVTASGQVDAGRKTATSGSFLAAENGSGYVFDGGWGSFSAAVTSLGGAGNRISSAGNIQLVCAANSAVAIGNGTNRAILWVYNTFTSDTSFERLNIAWASNICTIEVTAGSAGGTLRGLRIGGATTSLVGFYGATPVDRPDTVADPTGGATVDTEARTAIGLIIDRLQELGLIA